MSEEEKVVEKTINTNTKSYSCKNCGADMKYLPEKNALYCEHCGTEIKIDSKDNAKELVLTGNIDKGEAWLTSKTFVCKNCSAVIDVPAGQLSINCPFCGSANVIAKDDISGIKPNAILPFKFGKDKAVETYKTWVHKKWLMPRKLRKKFNPESLKGIYIPAWTFDTSAVGRYEGRVGKDYTVRVKTSNGYVTKRKIRWYHIHGSINRGFDDIIIEASDHVDDKDIENLGGFDTNNSVEYKEDYIAGFLSEHYKDDLNSSWGKAKQKAHDIIYHEIKRNSGADHVDYINIDVTYLEPTYKYVLMPLWICNYKYRNKDYRFLINGRSGKVSGKYPKALWVYILAVLVVLGIIAGIAYYFLA